MSEQRTRAEALDDFHSERNHSEKTRRHYRAALKHFGDGEFTSRALADYRDKRTGDGLAVDTVRGEVLKLRAFARYCGHEIKLQVPVAVRRAPVAWSQGELRRLFREARRTKRFVQRLPGNVVWPALLGVAYDTGERIGAILSIKWSDIDFDNHSITYRAEIRKGTQADKQAELSRSTIQALRKLHAISPDSPFMNGNPSALWKAYGHILDDAGLPSDRRSKFHRLRRTHATWLHRAGGDATASLGHASDATTRASYLDTRYLKKAKLPRITGGVAATVLAWLGWR